MIASAFAQQPPLAKDPGPFLPGFGVEQETGPKPVAGPAPHLPDGRPDFGGNGAWYPGFNGNIAFAMVVVNGGEGGPTDGPIVASFLNALGAAK